MISPHHFHPTNGVRPSDSLPKKPKSPLQRYRLLRKGKDVLA